MGNVIAFKSALTGPRQGTLGQLIGGFAEGRRNPEDVFWLKEVAELLGVLVATGTPVSAQDLKPLEDFYASLSERLRFFPQYYRFLLSICLDLEDLGLQGDTGAQLAAWVSTEGLVDAELSDLQRAEARRLLHRRGVTLACEGLDARLRCFIERHHTFALPNRKAAYELTHIVFYLSDYGRRDPLLDEKSKLSLIYSGLLAYLDQNFDLLAEVCTALRFAGCTPSPTWERAVASAHKGIQPTAAQPQGMQDAYHEYLVTGWALKVAGLGGFERLVDVAHPRFERAAPPQGVLRVMSESMYDLGPQRTDDWAKMRGPVFARLGQSGQTVMRAAEASTEHFAGFFAGFSRAPQCAALH
ncbi:MAG: hypothetical protein AAF744_00455 [Pseudomonadota bacterium]